MPEKRRFQAVVQPVAIQERAICENPDAGPDGAGFREDGTSYTLEARSVPQAIAFKASHYTRGKDGAPSTLAPPLSAAIRGRDGEPSLEVREDGTANAILTPNGGRGGIGVGSVAIGLDEEQNAVTDGIGCLKAREHGGGFEGSVMTPQMVVRRLTPMECERLQGVPDGYTLIPITKNRRNGKALKKPKPMADGPRYKMLGNGFAIPVVRWIGERIQQVEQFRTSAE